METLKFVSQIMAAPLVLLIWIYQKTISPDHGLLKPFFPQGFCKFYPSCSMYARQVLAQEGIVGLPKIIKRLLSCNPAALGGVDLP